LADLFAPEEQAPRASDDLNRPLADRVRPNSLDGFFGQEHLLADGKPLRVAIEE
jgi:putative ATPase